ncbi:hypothetical protein HMPREF0454_02568 [Hafnia alvei ATCC 51873]|uniref:Uncharacterized protein n=1 Tax=Hafnia alvei ATCC 51873 TaxID=1002364 RepID=G9Y7P4_HAFAL|nr:hypothetical protein HMPREF0454_02568 [Hafnia alvei ATCC 51873]
MHSPHVLFFLKGKIVRLFSDIVANQQIKTKYLHRRNLFNKFNKSP